MNTVANLLIFFLIYDFKVLAEDDRNWWKHTTIYEIYIWSFKDSNGDGIGDVNGIKAKLDHFVDLGIETLWVSPCYRSPMADMGYDVSNFTDIDPRFGTIFDFQELLKEAGKKGLKIIMDFVINHTSDEHPWFNNSINNINPYTDFYVWRDPKGYRTDGSPIEPNNWPARFGGSAWEWNAKRKQFYLHQFAVKQPDLNLRNPTLKSILKNMMAFWFDKGVAGARLDAANFFIEDALFRDETVLDPTKTNETLTWKDYDHSYTVDLWDSYELIHELRQFVDKKYNSNQNEKIFIVEAYTSMNLTMLYYGYEDYKIVNFPFNFQFVGLNSFPTPLELDQTIKYWLNSMPAHGVANWVSENHDNHRMGNRLNTQFADIMMMTILMLPGVACIYYGQEIGMLNNKVRPDQRRDPNSDAKADLDPRDGERLPMQWDDTMNAGFSSNIKPWLPANTNYWELNVESQKRNPNSRYNLFKALSKLRRTKTLKHGDFVSFNVSSWVYGFSRTLDGQPTYTIIMNLGTETEFVYLSHSIPKLPRLVKVVASSVNSGYRRGIKIPTYPQFPRMFTMRPLSALVFSTP